MLVLHPMHTFIGSSRPVPARPSSIWAKRAGLTSIVAGVTQHRAQP